MATSSQSYLVCGTRFDIDSQYQPGGALGAGGYGVVISAFDSKNNRKVAIKKVPHIFRELGDAKSTLREIRMMRHFGSHENIMPVIDIMFPRRFPKLPLPSLSSIASAFKIQLNGAKIPKFPDFESVYIVSPQMDSDLHRVIRSEQPISPDHVQFFMYQLIRAVYYLHSANVVHRDIKPGNVFVNYNCEARLGDFGISRSLLPSSSTRRRSTVTTPQCFSPNVPSSPNMSSTSAPPPLFGSSDGSSLSLDDIANKRSAAAMRLSSGMDVSAMAEANNKKKSYGKGTPHHGCVDMKKLLGSKVEDDEDDELSGNGSSNGKSPLEAAEEDEDDQDEDDEDEEEEDDEEQNNLIVEEDVYEIPAEPMTEYVVTRWYRSPELLLECKEYGKPVDLWSCGCVMAELLLRRPLWPGGDPIQMLNLITNDLGVPGEGTLKRICSPAALRHMLRQPHKPRRTMLEIIPGIDPQAADLLNRLLDLDPLDRITAEEALRHPYFGDLFHQDDIENRAPPISTDIENELKMNEDELKEYLLIEALDVAPARVLELVGQSAYEWLVKRKEEKLERRPSVTLTNPVSQFLLPPPEHASAHVSSTSAVSTSSSSSSSLSVPSSASASLSVPVSLPLPKVTSSSSTSSSSASTSSLHVPTASSSLRIPPADPSPSLPYVPSVSISTSSSLSYPVPAGALPVPKPAQKVTDAAPLAAPSSEGLATLPRSSQSFALAEESPPVVLSASLLLHHPSPVTPTTPPMLCRAHIESLLLTDQSPSPAKLRKLDDEEKLKYKSVLEEGFVKPEFKKRKSSKRLLIPKDPAAPIDMHYVAEKLQHLEMWETSPNPSQNTNTHLLTLSEELESAL